MIAFKIDFCYVYRTLNLLLIYYRMQVFFG